MKPTTKTKLKQAGLFLACFLPAMIALIIWAFSISTLYGVIVVVIWWFALGIFLPRVIDG
jgi:hypothetical protein